VSNPLLSAENIAVRFNSNGRTLHAVDGVTLEVYPGECLAIVGESGSGKSTLALALMRAIELASGAIHFDGRDITSLSDKKMIPVRRDFQMVFQDPYSSLDPRMTVRQIISEPMRVHKITEGIEGRVQELLAAVGLDPSMASRKPAQFSGGQRQRISIARALALKPKLIIADEPVSALDVSIQAQIVNLLEDIKKDSGISYVVISHDLGLVHHMADRIIVMYLGKIVEQGTTEEVVWNPQHPYTAALLSATPGESHLRKHEVQLKGDPPSPIERPTGCAFHPRCPIATQLCATETPELRTISTGRRVACHHSGTIPAPLSE
jgi:oligopeptide/dipeptide ABC transporter ATP-binding protein